MKTTFRALAAMTLLVATFASCKKDKNEPSATSSFTYDSKTYTANVGTWVKNDNYGYLMFSTQEPTVNGFDGKVSYVQIELHGSELREGTFTWKDDTDEDYDLEKNFYYGMSEVDITVSNWQSTGGTQLYDVQAGSVTIKKNGENYSISYTLTFENGKTALTGTYNGAIHVMNQPD